MNAEAALRSQDGKEEWTIVYSFNALCRLEEELGMSADKLANEIAKGKNVRLTTMRVLIYAGLKDRHPNMTIEGAGEVIQKVGMIETLKIAAMTLIQAFPEVKENPNPTKAIKSNASMPANS